MTRYHTAMRLAWLAVMAILAGCPQSAMKRPYPDPTVAQIVDRLGTQQAALTSFVADSNMDYWLGDQRVKGEVLVMGEVGAKVRFAALSPAGGSTMAEMACDGTNFVYVDHQKNCALAGPCDQRSIAQFFHIELAPDDFVHLALGTPPVLASPTGSVTWDDKNGTEKVVLHGAGGTERLTIDMKHGRFDVLDCELLDPAGKVQWSVANTDFVEVGGHRVPGKTRFRSPDQKEDLLVEWGDPGSRKIDEALAPDKFKLEAPAGLPSCSK